MYLPVFFCEVLIFKFVSLLAMDKSVLNQVESGKMLPLMEEFYTIQGEGFHKGTAAYFIRIGGCDVGCHWCDVKESWNADLHPPTGTSQIINMQSNIVIL